MDIYIKLNKKEKMNDYTMQQYYRGVVSLEMRVYIEEELRSEEAFDAAGRGYYTGTFGYEYEGITPKGQSALNEWERDKGEH